MEELETLKSPPTYTVLVSWSQRSAHTCPDSPGIAVTLFEVGSNNAMPCDSMPPKLVKFPPTTKPSNVPSFRINGHIAKISASAVERVASTPFGSAVTSDCEPLLVAESSDCSAYEYSDMASKSPVNATLPSGERSRSGWSMGVKDAPCAVEDPRLRSRGQNLMIVEKPAAAGPNSEGALIAQGATTDKGRFYQSTICEFESKTEVDGRGWKHVREHTAGRDVAWVRTQEKER